MWQIPPYQTKPVMKANFVARLESNHTAYIRIKTNTTGAEFLYLPLEVEVTSQPGIYSPQEVIDFGLVPSQSETKAVKLLVLNSGAKPIQIQNVIATPVTEAISINFKAVKVQPETLRPKVIAEMVFNRKFFDIFDLAWLTKVNCCFGREIQISRITQEYSLKVNFYAA